MRGVAFGFGVASPDWARPGVSSHMLGALGVVAALMAPTPPRFIFFFGPPDGVSPPASDRADVERNNCIKRLKSNKFKVKMNFGTNITAVDHHK